jgi:hypothetical protein
VAFCNGANDAEEETKDQEAGKPITIISAFDKGASIVAESGLNTVYQGLIKLGLGNIV